MSATYRCNTVSERGVAIGVALGLGAFVALAYAGYASGMTWLAVLGLPLILVGVLSAQRVSTYTLTEDGIAVEDLPARGWALFADPGVRGYRFTDIVSATVQVGRGREVDTLVLRGADGRRVPIVEDRLGGRTGKWRQLVRTFAAAAERRGLTVAGLEAIER